MMLVSKDMKLMIYALNHVEFSSQYSKQAQQAEAGSH